MHPILDHAWPTQMYKDIIPWGHETLKLDAMAMLPAIAVVHHFPDCSINKDDDAIDVIAMLMEYVIVKIPLTQTSGYDVGQE